MNALAIGRGIDLKKILKKPLYPIAEKERNLVVLQPGGESFIFVYSFGVLVFFNVEQDQKEAKKFHKFVHSPISKWPREDYAVAVGAESEVVTFDEARLKEFSLDKLIIIATVLAQSSAMDYIENVVDEVLRKFEYININLERKSELMVSGRDLIKTIGTTNLILQQILARLALLDKPDIAWDAPELAVLFGHMRKLYELDDRFRSIEFKLSSIEDNSKGLLSILQTRRAERLEIIIIVLIVVEVFLFVYEIFR